MHERFEDGAVRRGAEDLAYFGAELIDFMHAPRLGEAEALAFHIVVDLFIRWTQRGAEVPID